MVPGRLVAALRAREGRHHDDQHRASPATAACPRGRPTDLLLSLCPPLLSGTASATPSSLSSRPRALTTLTTTRATSSSYVLPPLQLQRAPLTLALACRLAVLPEGQVRQGRQVAPRRRRQGRRRERGHHPPARQCRCVPFLRAPPLPKPSPDPHVACTPCSTGASYIASDKDILGQEELERKIFDECRRFRRKNPHAAKSAPFVARIPLSSLTAG